MFSNAGTTSISPQTVLDLDLSEYDHVMCVNARGAAACVKHAARKMVELGTRGTIVCTASAMAAKGGPNLSDYVMSKHAVLGLVRATSIQLGAHGIRVNCVSPAAMLTPNLARLGITTPADVEKSLGPFTSLKGVALTAKIVAKAVLFLASDEAAFLTGHDLAVDGGLLCIDEI